MICANCETTFDSKFCPNCGQKADIHRVTLKYVLHDFMHAFTHADKGFLLLSKWLLVKPGIVAREYMNGRRKKYFNPLSFLVITSAIHAYLLYKSGYFMSQDSPGGNSRMPQIWKEVFELSNGNGKLLTLILIVPLLAFFSWLFFRRSKYNVAETFVLNSFIVGESNIIRTLIFIPLFLLFPQYAQLNLAVFEALLFIYLCAAYRQFFHQNIFLTILKALIIMVLFIISYWAFLLGYVYVKQLLF